jgi:hypothetical protein
MKTVWRRNLLFVGLTLFGAGVLVAGLWGSSHIREPKSFNPEQYQRAEFREIVNQVNQEFRDHWQTAQLQAAPRAPDLAIARRLSLGLTGTIPSLEEIRSFEAQPPEHRIEWWVSHLLEDRRYADYVAERLARVYVGTENGPFLVYRRRRFVTWLSDRLYENERYDQLVRKLISDEGLWTDSPAVNFVTVTLDQNNDNQVDEIRLAGRTARAFLGMRIDCLQCHDDRLGTVEVGTPGETRYGLQSDFHQLAAFYSEAQSSPLGIRDRDGDYKYQYLDAEQDVVVPPQVPFLPELLPGDGPRREQLAAWVTHPDNKPFARAIVNRVWALMFGRPLVEPIDNIPLYGTLPPALETLADNFVKQGYDLRRLIRLIAATDVFQLHSRADFEITPKHESRWAVFPLTRLRPEQTAGGLIQASSLTTIDAQSHIVFQLARYFQQNEFIKRYGDTGEDEFADRAGTIPQRLLMMNGELVEEKTKPNLLVNAATQIARLSSTDEKAIETAYLAVLTRRPSPTELHSFSQRLSGLRGDQRSECLQDIYWVLLNSTEFSWNH